MSKRILPRPMTPDERTYIERWPEGCAEAVTREGFSVPCEKPAVAVRVDPEDGVYPVCSYHARGQMVALVDLLDLVDHHGTDLGAKS